jgi:hypothetical protein
MIFSNSIIVTRSNDGYTTVYDEHVRQISSGSTVSSGNDNFNVVGDKIVIKTNDGYRRIYDKHVREISSGY